MGTPEAARVFLDVLVANDLPDLAQKLDSAPSFDALALHSLVVHSVSPGCVLARLHVAPRVQNRYTTLHGGCIGACVCVCV